MLPTPTLASTAPLSPFQPLSRQNTVFSYDGSRSARQSKRYSMSALYMSMSANESDLVIEDDLAKGMASDCVPADRQKTDCHLQRKRYYVT